MYEEEGGSKARLFIALGIGMAVIAVIAFLVIGRKPEAAKAPAKFVPFSASDNAFAGQAPDGWRREQAGGGGGMASGVTITQGRTRIHIFSDLTGSLMADISRAADSRLANPRPPVEKLHMGGKKSMEDKWTEYEETPGTPFQTPLGDARLSEWTGKKGGLLGSEKMHGLRVTMLSGERRITVTCQCPEDDWKTLRPTFSTVLKSLRPGSG
jgi:hypothetical protein